MPFAASAVAVPARPLHVPAVLIVRWEPEVPEPESGESATTADSLAFHVAAEEIRASANVPIHVGVKVCVSVPVVMVKPMLVSLEVASVCVAPVWVAPKVCLRPVSAAVR